MNTIYEITAIDLTAINITTDCVYADPCRVIPESLWGEYCALGMEGFEWQARTFRGISFETRRTKGDGCFFGAIVDSGTIGRFPLSVLTHRW